VRVHLRLGVLLLCVFPLACQRAPENQTPLRLIDRIPVDSRFVMNIDGELRWVLPWLGPEQRFPLVDAPTRPILTFAAGLKGRRIVRFEVLLEPKQGDQISLYAKEVDREGWHEERIDLSDRDLNGSTLVFRRTVLKGFEEPPPYGAWANPTLLPAAPAKRPSVILVSLDTLRADRVGAYGREGARTPALDQLAGAGVQYQRAYAPSTWTIPSHASLFYGAYLPDTPGVLRETRQVPQTAELPDRPIAEILRGVGYLTAGFTGGGFLGYPWDFSRGFDTYFSYSQVVGTAPLCGPQRFDGPEVFRRATEWLRRSHGAPFFLFVHTYDVHDRCPFFQPDIVTPDAKPFYGGPSVDRADHQKVSDYYDQMIEETDRRLAGLLAAVDALGLRDDTLVIVISDHGEGFSEHGLSAHGCDMKPYEELARVPLLVRFPGRAPAGERVAAPVSLIDVVPSILALLGLPREPKMAGGVLPGLGLPSTPGPSEPVYDHCGAVLAVWRGQHKLITWRDRRQSDEIYDLSQDPNERTNLGSSDPNAAALAADAEAFWKTALIQPNAPATNAQKPELDDATRQRLRDLGYLK